MGRDILTAGQGRFLRGFIGILLVMNPVGTVSLSGESCVERVAGQKGAAQDTVALLVHAYQHALPGVRTIVTTDRDCYFTGERIWFRARLLDDVTGIPVNRSSISYVEFTGPDGMPLDQMIFAHTENQLEGMLEIPRDIASGTYQIRSHTRWQGRYGPSRAGLRLVQVINPFHPPRAVKADGAGKRCRLFPDGGTLLPGIDNRLVAEVKSESGSYAPGTGGYILDERGDTAAMGITVTRGLASFSLVPRTDRSYTLVMPGVDSVPLKMNPRGSRVTSEQTEGRLRVRWSGPAEGESRPVRLVALCEGNLIHSRLIGDSEKASSLPGDSENAIRRIGGSLEWGLDSLPEGIVSFHLLDRNLNELSTLLRCHRPLADSPVRIRLEPEQYETRQAVELVLEAGEAGLDAEVSLSVSRSVFDLPVSDNGSWMARHWHSCLIDWDDFRQISFHEEGSPAEEVLEAYLATRKLRRHPWSRILSPGEDVPVKPAEEGCRIISGTVTDPEQGAPYAFREIQAFTTHPEPMLYNAVTDSLGRFIFRIHSWNLPDQMVHFRPVSGRERIRVSLDPPFLNDPPGHRLSGFYFDTARAAEYDRAFVFWQIRMLHGDRLKEWIPGPPYDSPAAFYGSLHQRYYLDDYVTFPDLGEVFREVVGHVRIRSLDDGPDLAVYDDVENRVIGGDPLVLLNGQPVTDLENLLKIPEKEVEYIDVVPRRFFTGNRQHDGLVNVVTRDRNLQLDLPDSNYRTLLKGTEPARRFHAPDYSADVETPMPDPRNTLYWDPGIRLRDRARIRFHTGDIPGTYLISVRGTDQRGRLIEAEREIVVVEP